MKTYKDIKLIDNLPHNKGFYFDVEGEPMISDFRASNLGCFFASQVEFYSAKEEGAHSGRGFYLRDQTGDTVGVFKTPLCQDTCRL